MAIAAAEGDFLLARARQGDLHAVGELFHLHSGGVYSLARRMGQSPEDAEDIVQETFVEVARSIRQYRAEGHLGGWIRRVAASKALMKMRRRRLFGPGEEIPEESMPPSPEVPMPERMDLEAALSRLPPASRAVVWLHDVEGLTHDEIAAMVGQTASYSKSKLARAHTRLRELLGPREETHAPRT